MFGRLLILAIGAVAGVIGKKIYDDHQASSSGSTYSKPSTSEDETDSAKEAD